MALVSISEAARLACINRSNLYSSYINPGKLSLSRDSAGRPKVDTSELLRVFGSLKTNATVQQAGGTERDSLQQTEGDSSGQFATDSSAALIRLLQAQLAEAKDREQAALEREQFYQQQIRELTGTLKLLEHHGQADKATRPWWRFWT